MNTQEFHEFEMAQFAHLPGAPRPIPNTISESNFWGVSWCELERGVETLKEDVSFRSCRLRDNAMDEISKRRGFVCFENRLNPSQPIIGISLPIAMISPTGSLLGE